MNTKRIIGAFVGCCAALFLAACSSVPSLPTVNLASAVNLNTVDGIVAGYGLVLNAENGLKKLDLCKTGTTHSITNICVRRSLIVRLQDADKVAFAAVNNLVAFTKANPTISPSSYISAARDALTRMQAIINEANGGTA